MNLFCKMIRSATRETTRNKENGAGTRTSRNTITAALIIAGVSTNPAMAANYTWDGGAGTSSWSDVANWDPDGLPSASVSCSSCYDLLIFNNLAGGILSNDVGWAYQLQFGSDAGSYNLGGPQSMESRGIDNQSSNLQTISMGGVHVYYGAIWDAGSGGLTVSSTVTLEPGLDGLTITGSADTLLNGNISTVIRPGLTSVVTKNGTGTLTLGGSGDEYFQLQIDEGIVSIDSSSWNGAAVTLSSGASLNINTANAYVGNISGSAGQVSLGNSAMTLTRNVSATFAGTITGFGGSLNKTGSGTLTLSGNNSYTGGTTFSGGTIAIISINNLGLTGSGLTFDGGTLQTTGSVVGIDRTTTLNSGGGTFNVDNNAVHTSAINGTGSLSKIGDGNLILSGSNSYSGGTTVSAGVLRCGAAGGFVDNTDYTVDGGILDLGGHDLSASALSGTGGVINLGSANLSVNQSSDTSFAGDMRGSGSFSKSGSGALTLSGSNSYSGGTTVSAGTLLGNTSSLQGDITNNANVVFDQTADDTFAGSISGSGSLTKSGSGVLTLTGVNTYSGGTTVSVGTLQGDSGSMQGDITNNARVIFNQGSDGTYSGDMSGSGTLIKSSSGVLTLTGANTFSGGTSVNAGTLYVNGSITSASTISASATLSGSGTLGSVTVNNGGILVPGNTTGELTTGALTLNDTSVLDFELGDPTGTAGVDSDLVSVNGDLTLDGGLNITTLTGFGVGSYRLFNYSGNLTDNTLTVAPLPVGYEAAIDTSTAGQVNLIVSYTIYPITLLDDGHGALDCSPNPVTHGSSATCTVTPDTGYSIASVSGCAGSLSGDSYTTGAITANCTVSASFSLNVYTVSAGSSGHGSISPASIVVSHGGNASFSVTPDSDYELASVSGCGGSLSGNTYTTGAITADCSVIASFSQNDYTVYTRSSSGGSISPESMHVSRGESASFSVTPDSHYELAGVSGCGGSLSGDIYTTGGVVAACTVEANFKLVLTLETEEGPLPTNPVLESGQMLQFSLSDSERFQVSVEPNDNGFSLELEELEGGQYRFIPPSSGAFAGEYLIVITDTTTGAQQTIVVSVPLQIELSNPAMLTLGEYSESEIVVRGATAGSVVNVEISSAESDVLPLRFNATLVAADDAENGNPATGTIFADATETSILFEVKVEVAGYPGNSAPMQLQPATTLSGYLYDFSGPVSDVVVVLEQTDASEGADLGFQTLSDEQGRFTLYTPPIEEGDGYSLLLDSGSHQPKSLPAMECLQGYGGCDVELLPTSDKVEVVEDAGQNNNGGGGALQLWDLLMGVLLLPLWRRANARDR